MMTGQQAPRLLETIRLENGRMPYLAAHQARLNASHRYYYDQYPAIDLSEAIDIPNSYKEGLFKLRVVYGAAIEEIDIQPYRIRPVTAVQLVQADNVQYAHKYADREALQQLFRDRTYGDDVLLIRDGLLTDTSYANIALFDGSKWFTPARPLLPGTARGRYLRAGLIHAADIHVQDLPQFREMRLINGMMEWEEAPRIAVEQIRISA
ncbi:aminotransferase class IV [Flavilitoribacter nigricans]|uniref:4-amino-4-deoxychorismate lyase n=1 Tax=Flavilitoribacter nigricans (strain ATCC 23147 / DSM 23189 / NBRC 102662 / NCIMB 1420 / SS-2) TaxID=1122177 RepID=A0A2D0NE35_FLAN2|nr:aminotransferase class IV [Flavilitoribacter nigricans]PHN06745.1 hypothetical protein CRP01_10655 [Flavilitoribacter nigricans DSM 23189 = NBRC 102662]